MNVEISDKQLEFGHSRYSSTVHKKFGPEVSSLKHGLRQINEKTNDTPTFIPLVRNPQCSGRYLIQDGCPNRFFWNCSIFLLKKGTMTKLNMLKRHPLHLASNFLGVWQTFFKFILKEYLRKCYSKERVFIKRKIKHLFLLVMAQFWETLFIRHAYYSW